ncbi:D-cysteine desulfhydrase [Neorhizobium sp. NCHU2750]|uniref:D-cysteine desulfhydrase n=1 Tax=Neorhizobium sp. NCHU2750 TaxID=1825976 RepID=UPI000EB721B3|nr:hypothetical protein NCHU2750_12260 [Neorhizobium sp. NCHU2750]
MSSMTSDKSANRVSLGFFPTPLEPLPRLSAMLGGPEIWVKRDDCTGLGGGGNKTRKLEYLIADALSQGADIVLTAGALQSNHARQTAAAAAKSGLDCALILAAAVPSRSPAYATSGNMLLDRIFGASMHLFAAGTDLVTEMLAVADDLTRQGRRPYIVPVGGSNAVGALGYCEAMRELKTQCASLSVSFDRIVLGTGSAGTQAGMVAGAKLHDVAADILGISVSGNEAEVTEKVALLATETLALAGDDSKLVPQAVVDDRFVGAGYGQPTEAVVEALTMCARLEGLLLDPVYTGKAMAGLIDHIRRGSLSSANRVLFWHTGGAQGLFAYPELFAIDAARK